MNTQNTLRHPDFINLKHKIQSSETIKKLSALKQVVLRFAKQNKEDGAELISIYLEKENDLDPKPVGEVAPMVDVDSFDIYSQHERKFNGK